MMRFDSISLERDMYKVDGGLTAALERLDSSENYYGTSLQRLDAFERQLKRYDIKVSGEHSDCIEKFFQTKESAILFPEYVRRAVKSGMDAADTLSDIIATTTFINGMDYRSISASPGEDTKTAVLPQLSIKTQENLVQLHKRGRTLISSYESLKYQRIELFTKMLEQIGADIRRAQFSDAVDVLLDASCEKIPVSNRNLGITFNDLLNLWTELSPYSFTTILAPADAVQNILSMPESQKRTKLLGAQIICHLSMKNSQVVGLDKNRALEMVQASDVDVDVDRLIDRQFEDAAITSTAGFSKIFKDASKALVY